MNHVIVCFFNTDEVEPYTKLITPMASHWNYVTIMIKSILKMRQKLTSICENPSRDDGNLSGVNPTTDDFNLFEECMDVMERIAKVSEQLSSDSTTTINYVMSNLYGVFPLIE